MVVQSNDKLPWGEGGGMRGLGTVITLYCEYGLANTCVSLQSASP